MRIRSTHVVIVIGSVLTVGPAALEIKMKSFCSEMTQEIVHAINYSQHAR